MEIHMPSPEAQGDEKRVGDYTGQGKTDMVINLINIADILDCSHTEVNTSNIVLIGIEPFALDRLIIDGIKQSIRIVKDPEGRVFINGKEARFEEIAEGIKILFIIREEKKETEE